MNIKAILNWTGVILLGAPIVFGVGAAAQQATRVIILNGSTAVSLSNPLPVTGGGGGSGGTSSTFGAAFPATGTAVGMSQGGNMVAFTGTANNLNVQCANCSGSGVSAVDEVAFTAGMSVFAPGGGFFQTTATANALTNGQQGMWQMTANRAGFVNLRTAAGVEIAPLTDTQLRATAIPVSGTVAFSNTTIAVTNAGTFATQSAITAASGSVASGAFASGSLAAGSMVDFLTIRGTKNAGTAAANSALVGGVYNSTPLTLTDTQQASLQADANGFLKVNVAAGGASGGTSSSFGSAFPATGTAIGLTNGTNMVAWSATSNYGTSPGAIAVPAVNANVTNSNANGSATSANSSPVVIASDQVAVAVKAASGTIASGAIASGAVASGAYASGSIGSGAIASGAFASGSIGSGAIASGAFASGAVASGAYASGSLASGAVVDITNISVAPGAAPPSKVVALGANASGATGGFMAGLIQCDSKAIYDASTNGSTELVALTSGRTIYVCGYSIVSGGTVNVKLIYGTGTACATGSNNMTPAFQLTAQVGLVDGSPFYRGLKTASANALCINTSAGVAAQAIVYYSVI